MKISGLLFDLDGTVYRGTEAIPGAAEFIGSLAIPYLFVTNRGNRTPDAVADQLRGMGIRCTSSNVLTSAEATAAYLTPGMRAFCIGEDGLRSALEARGLVLTDAASDPVPDVVVVGYDRSFDYAKLTMAVRHIDRGAQFVATNDDRIITVEDGIVPEAGPLVAAVEAASGRTPVIIGKPNPMIMETAIGRLGVPREECVIVGDNLATDILAGHNAGVRSVLTLTGVSRLEDIAVAACEPTWVARDYSELRRLLLRD